MLDNTNNTKKRLSERKKRTIVVLALRNKYYGEESFEPTMERTNWVLIALGDLNL